MCLFIVCIEASLVCAPFFGLAERRAKGINHTESGRSLTGSRNITVGHASRGHGFIHTSHCLIPRLLFPRSKKRLAQPQTHRHSRTHSLKHSQIGRFRGRKHSGKYFFECHLSLFLIESPKYCMNPRAVWLFYYLVSVVACSMRVIWVKWWLLLVVLCQSLERCCSDSMCL